MKIFISYLSLIHYRKSLFEKILSDSEYEVHIGAGDVNPIPNMKNFKTSDPKYHSLKNYNLNILGKVFTYQKGMLKWILKEKPQIVILLGVNPLILSSLYIFIYLKLFTDIKIIWWGHGTFGHQGKVGRKFREYFYKYSNGIIVYGEQAKKELKKIFSISIPIFVLGNCVNEEDYGFLQEKNLIQKKLGYIDKKKLHLVFSGRLTERKKIHLLLRAVQKLVSDYGINLNLIIIGEGPSKQKLIEFVDKNKLDNYIFFRGELYGQDLHQIFLKSHIYVLPAHAGLSVIHANSFGLPVITSNDFISHPPEVEYIINKKNGSFYESDSVDSLVDEVLYWKNKIAQFHELVLTNCIEIAAKYQPESIYKKFTHIFNYYDKKHSKEN